MLSNTKIEEQCYIMDESLKCVHIYIYIEVDTPDKGNYSYIPKHDMT